MAATSHTFLHHFQFMTHDLPVTGEILMGFCLHVAIWQEILTVVFSRLTTLFMVGFQGSGSGQTKDQTVHAI